MDSLEQGNDIIHEVIRMLNEVNPDKCVSGLDFAQYVKDNPGRTLLDDESVMSVAAGLEIRLLSHVGTSH